MKYFEKLRGGMRIRIMAIMLVASLSPMLIVGGSLYLRTIRILTRKQYSTSLNSLSNIGRNVNTIVNNARQISLQLIQSQEVSEFLITYSENDVKAKERYASILRMLSFYISQNSYLDSILLQNGQINVSVYSSWLTHHDLINNELETKADKLKGGQLWISEYRPFQHSDTGRYEISLLRTINSLNTPSKKIGILRIMISESAIAKLFIDDVNTYEGQVYLIDKDGTILSASERMNVGNNINDYIDENRIIPNSVVANNQEGKLLACINVEGTDWKLINSMPINIIMQEASEIRNIVLLFVFISILLCAGLVLLISHSFVTPIERLALRMRTLQDDHYKSFLPVNRSDEIGVLYQSFNEMSNKLDEMINQVFEQKLHREEAELKAMQAQINPHFLYNNLDTAYWMSRIEGADRTGKIVLALSKLFKLSIRNALQEIFVSTEIEHVKNYIIIERIRLEDAVTFTINMESDTQDLLTSRFVLQPLVENAISHGILPSRKHGEVGIHIYSEDNSLIMTVSDNGIGGDVERINALLEAEESDSTEGFAIRNVHSRISLRCGAGFGLHYEKNPNGGLTAIVRQSIVKSTKAEGGDNSQHNI